MARSSPIFICRACGGETFKWQGQCPHCDEWNTLEQGAALRPAARGKAGAGQQRLVRPVGGVKEESAADRRLASGQEELDRVLGGGIVPGSVTLLGGDPGIGKSTLLLQVAAHVGSSLTALYASGEESVGQVSALPQRLGLSATGLGVVTENDLEAILALASERQAPLLVVDSIQTVQLAGLTSGVGAVTQLRECTAELVRHAKSTGTAVMLIGHVTKEGAIAGPRML